MLRITNGKVKIYFNPTDDILCTCETDSHHLCILRVPVLHNAKRLKFTCMPQYYYLFVYLVTYPNADTMIHYFPHKTCKCYTQSTK